MNLLPGRYRHYKGKYYEVIGRAKHSETEEDLVVYRDDRERLWVRPLAMFTEQVQVGDATLPRFAYVGPGDETSSTS